MLDRISGIVKSTEEKTITVSLFEVVDVRVYAVGSKFEVGTLQEIFLYLHWSQENGPSLFGFQNVLERDAFKLLLGCPKIGPSLAMSILMQFDPVNLFTLIKKEEEIALSKITGVGPKLAKNMIVFIKKQVESFLLKFHLEQPSASLQTNYLQDLKDALSNLGYGVSEINTVLNSIRNLEERALPFDQLLRKALSLLRK